MPSTPLVTQPKPAGIVNNAPMNFQLAPGTVLADRYQIQQRVGGGGMGSVYKATDRNLAHRVVAVKEMIELFAKLLALQFARLNLHQHRLHRFGGKARGRDTSPQALWHAAKRGGHKPQ